jgi:hypothetical protein
MDDIVKQAMAKWPNVPHCFGWLALDARGGWRMRDERAQALQLAGDRINNAALLAFINRNYQHDEQGRWYFQNGPQRVYVSLEVAPYIAHTDPARGFVLQTGENLDGIDAAWLTEAGRLIMRSGEKIAALDDRDMAQCLTRLKIDGAVASDEQLLDWLAGKETATSNAGQLMLDYGTGQVAVERIAANTLGERFGFVNIPQPDAVPS